MKKALLLGIAALASANFASAAEPVVLPEFYSMSISRDGTWLFSDDSTQQIIYNIATKKNYVFEEIAAGNGNVFAADGTMVGSTYYDEPLIIRDGKMDNPASLSSYGFCVLNGITSAGSRIVGLIGNPDTEKYPGMWVPMYADVKADGTVGEPVILPCPATDFLDKPIQYCSATWVSNDGKVILGQMIDDSGMFISPIVYTEGTDGEWSYALPTKDLFNPNHLELPEDPGEFTLTPPDPKSYMSEEQQAAYDAAYNAWVESGYDSDLYPNYEDFMDADKYAEYSQAVDDYNAAAQEYNEKLEAYYEIRSRIWADSPAFEQNQMCLTVDGKKFLVLRSYEIEDENAWWPISAYEPWVFDLTDNSYKKYTTTYTDILAYQLLNDGTIIGSTSPMTSVPCSYIYLPGASDYIPILEYFETTNPEYAQWMKDNLTAQVEAGYDEQNDEIIYEDITITGHVVASDDFKVISGGVMAYYLPDSEYSFLSYIIGSEYSGIAAIEKDSNAQVKILKDGSIKVKGEIENLNVCDLSGRTLFSAKQASGTVATGLKRGIYIVTYNNGDEKVASKVKF